jgi:hypothetical protein
MSAALVSAAAVVITATASRPAPVSPRPACPCPDHPDRSLLPLPGGAARGTCPVDSRSYQVFTPEVTP